MNIFTRIFIFVLFSTVSFSLNAQVTPPGADSDAECGADCWDLFQFTPFMDAGGNVIGGEGLASDNNCNTTIDAFVEYDGMDSNGPDFSGTSVGANNQGISTDTWTFSYGTALTNPVFDFGGLRTNTNVLIKDCDGNELMGTCIASCGTSLTYVPGVGYSGDPSYKIQLTGTYDCINIFVEILTSNDAYTISSGTCLGADPFPPCVTCAPNNDFKYISLKNKMGSGTGATADVELDNILVGSAEVLFSDLDINEDLAGTTFGGFDNDGGTYLLKLTFCEPISVQQFDIINLEVESEVSIGTAISGSGASAVLSGLALTQCAGSNRMQVGPAPNEVITDGPGCSSNPNGSYTLDNSMVSELYFKYHNPPGGCSYDYVGFKIGSCVPDINTPVVPQCPLTLVTFTNDIDAYIANPDAPANSDTYMRDANGVYFNMTSCPSSIPTSASNPVLVSPCAEVVDEQECTVCTPVPPCNTCDVGSTYEYINLKNFDMTTMTGEVELNNVLVGTSELLFSDLDIREDFAGTTFGGFDNDGGTFLMKLSFCEPISFEELAIRNLEVESEVSIGTTISGSGASAILGGMTLTQCAGSSRMGVGPAPNEVITDGPGCGANPNGSYQIDPMEVSELYFKYHNPVGGCSFDYVGFKLAACVPDLNMVIPTCPLTLYEVTDAAGNVNNYIRDGMGNWFNDNTCPTTLPTTPQQTIAVSPCAMIVPLIDCEVCVPVPVCAATDCPIGTSFDYINFKSGEAILPGGNVGTIELLYSDLDYRTDVHGTVFGGFDNDGGTMIMKVSFCAPITIQEVDVRNLEVDSEIEIGTTISGSGKTAVLGGLDLVTCADPSGRMGPSTNPNNSWNNFVKTDGPGCGANPNATYNFTNTSGGLIGGSITTDCLYFKYNNPETGTSNDDSAYDLIWGEDCRYDYVGFRLGVCVEDPALRTEMCPWDKYIMETPSQSIPVWVDANGSMYDCDNNGGPKASNAGYLFEMDDLPPSSCLPIDFCLILEDQYEPNNNWFYVEDCDAPDATATPFGTAVPECPLEVFEIVPQCLQTDCSYGTATVIANPEEPGAGTYIHDFWLVIPGGVDCWNMRLANLSNIGYRSISIGTTHADLVMLGESDNLSVSFCGAIPCTGGATTPCGDVVVAARLIYEYDGSGSMFYENIIRWDAPGGALRTLDCQYISSVNPVSLGYADCPGATPVTVVKDFNDNYFDYNSNTWPSDITGLTDAFDLIFVSTCDMSTALCGDASFTDPQGVCSICVIPGLAKAVTDVSAAASGIPGNVDVTYKFTLINYGGAEMENLVIQDNFTALSGYEGVTTGPMITLDEGLTPAIVNAGFNGNGNLLNGSSGSLSDGEALCVEVVIEFDASSADPNEVNVAQGGGTPPGGGVLLLDDSVAGLDPDPDGDGDPSNNGDPTGAGGAGTPLYFPAINAAKAFINVTAASSGTLGNYDATVQIVIQNTGNLDLNNLSLIDDLNTQLTGAFVNVVTLPSITSSTATTDPTLNGSFDGSSSTDIFNGTSGLLEPGQVITIQFIIEIDPNASSTNPINNQATASADAIDPSTGGPLMYPDGSTVTVMDDSDSGTDPNGNNPNAPGGTSGSNDPSPLYIPRVDITKNFVSIIQTPCNPVGNVNASFRIRMLNTGSSDLTNLTLTDDLATEFGTAFYEVVDVKISPENATALPGLAPGYNGETFTGILNGTSGYLKPNESFAVLVTVSLNPNAVGADKLPFNQASGTADGIQFDEITITVDDISDSGDNGNTTNPGEPGDLGTSDDPTPFPLANVNSTKQMTDISPASSGVQGNVDITYEMTVMNTGNVTLSNITATDPVSSSALFGCAFVGVVEAPSLVSSSATSNPGIGTGFNGMNINNLITGGGTLECNESFTITFTIEINPTLDCAPASMCNQAEISASGLGPNGTDITITDLTDDSAEADEYTTPESPCSNDCTNFPLDCYLQACSSFTCNNNINITVNPSCEVDLTADMLLEGVDSDCLGDIAFPSLFDIVLYDFLGNPLPLTNNDNNGGVTVDLSGALGQELQVSVTGPCGPNSCWGTINVEDKNDPTIDCEICPEINGTDASQYDEECLLLCYEQPILQLRYDDRLRDDLIQEDYEDFADDAMSDNCNNWNENEVSFYDSYESLGACEGTRLKRTWTVGFTKADGSKGSVSCTREYFFAPIALSTAREYDQDPLTGQYIIEPIEDTLVLPPASISLPCGVDISPAGIAAFFDSPLTVDRDTDDNSVDPDELDVDLVVENNEGYAWGYPHYYQDGVGSGGPHAQKVDNEVCSLISGYTDTEIEACAEGCAGNRKLLRSWLILDWCTGQFIEYQQIIKSQDTAGPQLSVPNTSASVDPWNCNAMIYLPAPEHIADDCDANITYYIGNTGGYSVTGNAETGYMLHDVPLGTHTIEYLSEDCCGNVGTATMQVTVVDQTGPVAVSKEFIVISLTNVGNTVDEFQGFAKIYAEDIDNGSYDGCTDITLEVRRSPVCDAADAQWGPFVT
ncbi:MAG: hypothetical protein HKN51_12925, partial [Saprospiraceae bacterium]|nr:hypothetical protein [Saprospiraceae bacterium]